MIKHILNQFVAGIKRRLASSKDPREWGVLGAERSAIEVCIKYADSDLETYIKTCIKGVIGSYKNLKDPESYGHLIGFAASLAAIHGCLIEREKYDLCGNLPADSGEGVPGGQKAGGKNNKKS